MSNFLEYLVSKYCERKVIAQVLPNKKFRKSTIFRLMNVAAFNFS